MPIGLSPRTKQLVAAIFSPELVAEAAGWLEAECGSNLPFCADRDESSMERIRFAAIRLSEGSISKLLVAIELAQRDWRDLLMEAGFGRSVTAHESWARSVFADGPLDRG